MHLECRLCPSLRKVGPVTTCDGVGLAAGCCLSGLGSCPLASRLVESCSSVSLLARCIACLGVCSSSPSLGVPFAGRGSVPPPFVVVHCPSARIESTSLEIRSASPPVCRLSAPHEIMFVCPMWCVYSVPSCVGRRRNHGRRGHSSAYFLGRLPTVSALVRGFVCGLGFWKPC